MHEDREIAEIIEQYLAGELHGEALNEFKRKLEADPLLQQEVEMHRNLQNAFERERAEQDFRATLKEVYKDHRKEQQHSFRAKKSRKIWVYTTTVAASAVVLMGIALLFYPAQPAAEKPDLYHQYFEPYPVLSTVRSVDTSLTENLEKGLSAYTAGDYSLALEFFKKAWKEDPDSTFILFYCSMAHLGLNQPEDALGYFERIIQGNDGVLKEEARWYKSLALYKMNEIEACKKILRQITESDRHYKKKEAKDMLSALVEVH